MRAWRCAKSGTKDGETEDSLNRLSHESKTDEDGVTQEEDADGDQKFAKVNRTAHIP